MATNIPAAQSGRGDRRLHRAPRQSRDLHRRAVPDRPGPGLPDRRPDPRPRRHPLGLPQGPRLDPHARPGRTSRRSARTARRSIVTAIPYQVNKATLIEKIADMVREKKHRGHLRHLGRDQPRRHAHRHRAEARRGGRRGAEPALALLRPADDVRRQHAGDQRRPARAAQPQGHDRRLHRPSARRWSAAAPSSCCARRATARTCLVGLAIAVANIDEVIKLIRAAPSPAGAREQLMARDWPAKDIGAAGRADRRSAPQGLGRRHLSSCPRSRPAPSSTCACSA